MPTNNFDKQFDTDEIWLLLSLYADGQATPEQTIEFELLLEHNPELRSRLNMVKQMSRLLQDDHSASAPADLTSRICTELHRVASTESVDEDTRWEVLSRFADGEAAPNERLLVEAKLGTDPVWQEDLNMIHAAGMALRTMSAPEAPAQLTSSILSAVKTADSGRVSRVSLRQVAGFARTFAAGAAAAVLLGYVALNSARNQDLQTPAHDKSIVHLERMPAAELGMPDAMLNSPDSSGTHVERVTAAGREKRIPVDTGLRMAKPQDGSRVLTAKADGSIRGGAVSSSGVRQASFQGGTDADGAESADVQPAVLLTPGMDKQNQRPPVLADSNNLVLSEPTDTGNQQAVVSVAEMPAKAAPTGSVAANGMPSPAGAANEDSPRRHTASLARAIGTHLTALPPDANQVLTRGDMARNRAATFSGYDKLSLRNMERKEASFFLLRGSF